MKLVERLQMFLVGPVLGLLCLSGCTVGPHYSKPVAPVAPAYKETPANWKQAQPADEFSHGKWWVVYQDAALDQLEEKVDVSNQNLKAAESRFQQARAAVAFNRASYFPLVTMNPSASRNRLSKNRPLLGSTTNYTDLDLPVDVSYEPDLWGRVRHTVEAARANAQASAADLESLRLSVHAELAMDYFAARASDAEVHLLDSTVTAYEKAMELTNNRYKGGIASQVDVAQAQTQLETTRALAVDLTAQRAAYEHAIAVLTGEVPANFVLPPSPLNATPPVTPPGLPSDLLERRPDIAEAERRMVAANAQIGIARAAYFPSFTVSATGGFEGTSITNWLSGPSGFAAAGLSALETIFDAGARHAVSQEAQAGYDESVANYRQSVLTAFQEVEDDLAALRILENESKTEGAAVAAAEHSLALSNNRYRGGVATYLEVITAQSAALADERTAVELSGRRMTDSVLLIKALGGGWSTADLPTAQSLAESHSSANGQN